MCSIIGSFSKEKFKELVELNQFRGNFSCSITIYNTIDNKIRFQHKSFGKMDFKYLDIVELREDDYIIGHVQAPTGGMIEDIKRIHPVEIEDTYLYHNGIITPRGIKFLQNKLNYTETFDTWLLHKSIEKFGFDILSEIEGLFSCLYIKDNKIYIFRTRHGKLYIDSEMSISSERFEDSKCINYDTVYEVDLINKTVNTLNKFKTLRCNIVVQGEM